MLNCSKGKVLKGDPDATPWSCEELGPRTFKPVSAEYDYCASRGEDCRSMSCCAGAQDSCYLKNPDWGSCQPSCTSTGNWTKGWSCEKLY